VHIAVLAATGSTGRHLLTQALNRGHTVTALVRSLDSLSHAPQEHLRVIHADVHDPKTVARALDEAGGDRVDVVISALGNAKGAPPGALTAGARAVLAAHPRRLLWLGAFGTGPSAAAAGPVARNLLAVVLRSEMADKTTADNLVLDAGSTLFHAGRLTNGAVSTSRRTVPLTAPPQRLFPGSVSRATVAAAMLDEAEGAARPGQILVPFTT
jgi:uncharacterized protein